MFVDYISMNFWSFCTHFNIYFSFWRFWNAASFNLVLTSFSLEYVITRSYFCHFPVLARIFWQSSGFVDHFCKQCFYVSCFYFCSFHKNKPAGWSIQLDFCNIDTSRNFPFWRWRETITRPASASCYYSNCHWPRAWRRFRRTRPSRPSAADSLRWQ